MPVRVDEDAHIALRLELRLVRAEGLGVRGGGVQSSTSMSRCTCICWSSLIAGHFGGTWSVSSWNARLIGHSGCRNVTQSSSSAPNGQPSSCW